MHKRLTKCSMAVLIRDAGVQVYVSVYADGPTRVLRFADEKSTALLEAEQSILDLAARLKQVCHATTKHYYPMYRVIRAASLHVYAQATNHICISCMTLSGRQQ